MQILLKWALWKAVLMCVFWEFNLINNYMINIPHAFHRIYKPPAFKCLYLWNGGKACVPTVPCWENGSMNGEGIISSMDHCFLSWNKTVMGNKESKCTICPAFHSSVYPLLPPFSLSFLSRFNLLDYTLHTTVPPTPPYSHHANILSFLLASIVRGCLPSLELAEACSNSSEGSYWHSEIKSESCINLSSFSSHLGLLLWCWWLVIKDLLMWEIK